MRNLAHIEDIASSFWSGVVVNQLTLTLWITDRKSLLPTSIFCSASGSATSYMRNEETADFVL
jgi:hypothetical protein